jgi:ATP-dependent DNA helicase RecG
MLDSSIKSISGVGQARTEKLEKMGITTVGDMLSYYPSRLEDRRISKKITELCDGEETCVTAIVISPAQSRHFKKNFAVYTLSVRDDTASASVVFYNQPYVMNNFKVGAPYNFYGKVSIKGTRREIVNPIYEPFGVNNVTNNIVPTYRLTSGITQKFMVSAIKKCFEAAGDSIEDFMPKSLCEKYHLCRADYALRNIHFPADFDAYESARGRLAFEELFLLSLALKIRKNHAKKVTVSPFADVDTTPFTNLFPYEFTNAQKKVLSEIKSDLASPVPMNRLVQGDVGSGKTAIASAALYLCAKNGFQGALMAPTELLAKQHYESIEPMFSKLGIKTVLLTGSMTKKEKRLVYEALENKEADIVIGTHTLFQDSVTFASLRLVVTDEQHRFGVRQRGALVEKGCDPHILVMTATPIPRTLALIIYGDLDVSVIDEMPPGRQKTDTFCISESGRERMYKFVEKEVAANHKAYIVCPMVDENEEMDITSATKYYHDLQKKIFPQFKIGLVHGKMSSSEKNAAMEAFAFGDIDILVSTTVIEVGVNVPQATLMIIENAERFGLSQLHQLRGRVGRGSDKSYCVLVVSHLDEDIKRRMEIMTKTNDGFEISQTDLKMRGPGEFFGTRQHGLPPLKISSLLDMDTLKKASEAADELLLNDPLLEKEENSLLKKRAENLLSKADEYLV